MEAQRETIQVLIKQMDKRFEQMQHNMDKRFAVGQWMIGLGWVSIVGLMTLYQYLN